MNKHAYLVGAYLVFWGLAFLVIASIWLRQRKLDRRLSDLAQRLAEEQIEVVRAETASQPSSD